MPNLRDIPRRLTAALTAAEWKRAAAVTLLAALALLPFIGLTDFNTKGEPREAIVAQAMLTTGNWVLPEHNDGEFAYKPPMLHWAVAACSLPGGEVTELTSRLPSALAAVLIALTTYLFFARRRDEATGLLAAVVFLTCSEVHRAATSCRVDMLLAAFIVLACYALARWVERGARGVPLAAVLCMGCGTLTKGPVAILLPCIVAGAYLLCESPQEGTGRRSRLRALIRLAATALCALALPALWYWAAFRQGGDKFLYLVYEENVLRFLGRMPYPSHEHSPLYYVPLLLAGVLPWTLLCLMAPLGKRRMRLVKGAEQGREPWYRRAAAWWRGLDGTERFAWLAATLVVAFYMIPKSKRGIYLLPAYPFVAYLVARLALWLNAEKPRVLRAFEWALAALVVLGVAAWFAVQTDWGSATLARFGGGNPHTAAMLNALRQAALPETLYLVVAVALIAIFYILQRLPRAVSGSAYNAVVAWMLLDAFVLPPILSARSDKPLAERIVQYAAEMPVYTYIDDPSGMMHFFTLNFYTRNRLETFPATDASERFNTEDNHDLPREAFLLVGERDAAAFRERYPQYECALAEDLGHVGCDVKQPLLVYRLQQRGR